MVSGTRQELSLVGRYTDASTNADGHIANRISHRSPAVTFAYTIAYLSGYHEVAG